MSLQTKMAVEIFAAVTAAILLFGHLSYRRDRMKTEQLLTHLFLFDILMLTGDVIASAGIIRNSPAYQLGAILAAISYYMILATMTFFVLYTIREAQELSLAIGNFVGVVCLAGIILWSASAINGRVYSIVDERFAKGPLFIPGLLPGVVVFVTGAYLLIRYRRALGMAKWVLLVYYLVLPLSLLLIRFPRLGIGAYYLLLTLVLLILYSVFYVSNIKRLQEQERQLADSRIKIMMSQIQPHFLYNSLNSIYYLCEKDPQAAQHATRMFSDYLRANLDSLRQTLPIPFKKELQHTAAYLALEKIRFEEDLNVVWEVEEDSFMIPALSLQPLVENAVKYGVLRKEGGGTVTIRTREEADAIVIEVEDDGVGYDPNAVQYDGRTHIGIDNVRERLKMMSGGTLSVTSRQGEGTLALIRLPK